MNAYCVLLDVGFEIGGFGGLGVGFLGLVDLGWAVVVLLIVLVLLLVLGWVVLCLFWVLGLGLILFIMVGFWLVCCLRVGVYLFMFLVLVCFLVWGGPVLFCCLDWVGLLLFGGCFVMLFGCLLFSFWLTVYYDVFVLWVVLFC